MNLHSKTARRATGLAVVVSVIASGCGSPAKPKALPASLLPTPIDADDVSEGGKSLRVRVYVGADHRARVVEWEAELERIFAQSSALLHKDSGLVLELVESVDWDRSGGPIDKTLAALVSTDPGRDVDVVLGIVDAAEEATVAWERLVAVEPSRRHVVIRGFHRQAELATMGEEAASLGEKSVDRLLSQRRLHKQSISLTHGIASLFGETQALGGEYSIRTASVEAEAGKRLGQAVKARRLEREALAATTRQTREEGTLRRVDVENLGQVRLLIDADKPDVAWEILVPLLDLYPDHREISETACLVADARGASDVGFVCTKAATLGAASPSVYLALGKAQIAADPKAALESLRRAESLMESSSDDWLRLAEGYKALGLATHALKAAKRTTGASEILKWANEVRFRYAVHVGVDPDSEGMYTQALKASLKDVYAGNFAAASRAARTLSSEYPKSAGPDLVECEIGMHKRNYERAMTACEGVLSLHPENSWARYLQGVALGRLNRSEAAIGKLREAIEGDPSLEAAYKALKELYGKKGDPRLSELRSAYKAQFGKSL